MQPIDSSEEAKQRLFKIMDDIIPLAIKKANGTISDEEDFKLRNLEVNKMQAYSDWKDPID